MSFTPPTGKSFPDFLQFQKDGQNLGGPDVTTVNFTGAGVQATRGTGANASVLTVQVAGGGGGGGGDAGAFVARLEYSQNPYLAGSSYVGATMDQYAVLVPAPFVSVVEPDGVLLFSRAGVYEFVIHGQADYVGEYVWPPSGALYGSLVVDVTSEEVVGYSMHHYHNSEQILFTGAGWAKTVGWTDVSVIEVSQGDARTVNLYVDKYEADPEANMDLYATLIVRRLGDLP